jgi:hypothetical protein
MSQPHKSAARARKVPAAASSAPKPSVSNCYLNPFLGTGGASFLSRLEAKRIGSGEVRPGHDRHRGQHGPGDRPRRRDRPRRLHALPPDQEQRCARRRAPARRPSPRASRSGSPPGPSRRPSPARASWRSTSAAWWPGPCTAACRGGARI